MRRPPLAPNSDVVVRPAIITSRLALRSDGSTALPGTAAGMGPQTQVPPSATGITNAQLAPAPATTLKGNATAGAAVPQDLTAAQAAALLATTTPYTGTVTVALAKLTGTGTDGSLIITCVNGLVTALTYSAPT